MKQIPFYPNDEDNKRSIIAIYRILFEYFLGKKTFAGEMEEFVGFKEGEAISTLKAMVTMSRKGFAIRMVKPFGNQSYPEFLKVIKPEIRQATLKDIEDMLYENKLVLVTLNGNALNDKEGEREHAVLVLQRKGHEYIIHDPGLPPEPYRAVDRDLFWKAMGAEDNISEVSGFALTKAHSHRRLDRYVLAAKPRLSRAFAAKLIDQGKVLVNGKPNKPGFKLHENDIVTIDYDEAQLSDIPKIDLPVIYEDEDCIVINKPAGVLTHAQSNLIAEGTVATFLRDRINDDSLAGDRAGIVHRLDRATSGVIVGAKNESALGWLQKQFADRKAKKTYMAIVEGHLKQPEAIIDMPIERNPKNPSTFRVGPNGKQATTHYKVLRETDNYSLVELKPTTGRTHQLRVHFEELKHPIVGDTLYGKGKPGDRLYLHAMSLELTLPNGELQKFTTPTPDEFEELLGSE